MRASDMRVLLPLLKRVHHGETPSFRMRSAAQFLLHRLGKPSKKGKKAAAQRKETKRAAGWTETVALRVAVMQRAGYLCEACGICYRDPPLQMDHWMSGVGRRRQKQSKETCWALCPPCHSNRTHNLPSAAYWNEKFATHCTRFGYDFTPHIIHQQLSTQGPEASIPPNAETPVSGRKEEA
jgi:5-methylcytosine-specific restriction endonuclease McrA